MNLPRLSPEQIVAVLAPYQGVPDDEIDWDELVLAAAEAQRLKDEQWMREQKPVALLDREGREVLLRGAAPVPASQGNDDALRKLREKIDAMESLFNLVEMHRDKHRATATEGINTANEALTLLAALAAPVTTKEAEHG